MCPCISPNLSREVKVDNLSGTNQSLLSVMCNISVCLYWDRWCIDGVAVNRQGRGVRLAAFFNGKAISREGLLCFRLQDTGIYGSSDVYCLVFSRPKGRVVEMQDLSKTTEINKEKNMENKHSMAERT